MKLIDYIEEALLCLSNLPKDTYSTDEKELIELAMSDLDIASDICNQETESTNLSLE